MNLEDVLQKEADQLNAEEKEFLKEKKDELNDQQKEAYASVLEEGQGGDDNSGGDNTGDNSGSNEGNNQNDQNQGGEGQGDNPGSNQGEGQGQASNKPDGVVTMTKEEADQLKADAQKGRQAHDNLALQADKEHIDSLIMGSRNEGGKLPPVAKDAAVELYHSLTANQRKHFDKLVEQLPKPDLFASSGDAGQASLDTASAEIDRKAKELQANDKELKYGDAVTKVKTENPQLAEEYNKEVSPQEV